MNCMREYMNSSLTLLYFIVNLEHDLVTQSYFVLHSENSDCHITGWFTKQGKTG